MKVLMFGWEFPPHILGGLGTASYGMTAGLAAQPDMDITFCIPKPWGDEDKSFMNIIGLSETPIVWRDVDYDYVRQRLGDRMTPEQYFALRDHIYADFSYRLTDDLGCIEFSGRYPDNLQEEINNYSIVAGVIARQQEYDIIHAHDWLTYPAGIHAKQVSGKPLVVHVHATDFDRSRGNVNPTVYAIERDGMDHADCIMCVSELTRRTVIDHYGQDPAKVVAMHNAVSPLPDDIRRIVAQRRPAAERKEKVVTFLGRITMQKGPEYFVEAAALVLKRTRNIRFCFAGSGDMMEAMIELAARHRRPLPLPRLHERARSLRGVPRLRRLCHALGVRTLRHLAPRSHAVRRAFHHLLPKWLRRNPRQVHQNRLLGHRSHGRCHVFALRQRQSARILARGRPQRGRRHHVGKSGPAHPRLLRPPARALIAPRRDAPPPLRRRCPHPLSNCLQPPPKHPASL